MELIIEAKLILGVAGTLISFLLMGNIFFVKKLVDKIEVTSEENKDLKGSLGIVKEIVDSVGKQLTSFKDDLKEIRKIEIDVAILKDKYNHSASIHK